MPSRRRSREALVDSAQRCSGDRPVRGDGAEVRLEVGGLVSEHGRAESKPYSSVDRRLLRLTRHSRRTRRTAAAMLEPLTANANPGRIVGRIVPCANPLTPMAAATSPPTTRTASA